MKLHRHYVEKPWGRMQLPAAFDPPEGKRIGEVWLSGGDDLPLLAKFIFTSEPLSVQVHPDNQQARARGFATGKNECWYILEAEAGSKIGLGLRREVRPENLREAALDGSIVDLLDWRSVQEGDFYFVPAGTIHAIGGGLSLLEIQQNSDVTYRLYDYGRPRPLALDDGIAVARPGPYPAALAQHLSAEEERTLVDGPEFKVICTSKDILRGQRRWVIPLAGSVRSGTDEASAGECLLLDPDEKLECHSARMLIAESPCL